MAEPTAKQVADFEAHFFKPAFTEKHGDAPVSWRRLDKALARLRTHIIDAILPAIANQLRPMVKRADEIERRLAELEANGPNLADCYRGVWMYGTYKRGNLVTHSGSIFLALRNTGEKPATSDAWKLVVKAGRDGKDAR